jgi:hypothetical protein
VISGTADKASVFVASGSQICGFTKRGKDFFKLDSSHTDAILHLHVQAQELWSTGKHTLNCYVSTENRIVDKYYYVAEDFIVNMKVVIMTKPTPVIAVGDKIRTIDGHGKMLY